MGSMAHPLRGIITEPIEGDADTKWQSGLRCVTISVTPSGASYPRTYFGVPYSILGESSADFKTPPSAGDYVDVIFKGGSSEFPTVIGRHGGTATSQAAALALSSRSAVPAGTASLGILSASLSGTFPELKLESSGFSFPTMDPTSLNPFALPMPYQSPNSVPIPGITGIAGPLGETP